MSPDAHVELGEKYYVEGELDSAVIEFKNALQSNPDHAQARWGLALVYLDQANGPAAEKELRRARDLGVAEDAVLVPMTRALMLQNKLEEVKAQQPDLSNLPQEQQAEYYTLVGEANLRLDDTDEAERAYKAALALADSPEARLGIARVAGVRGEVEPQEMQQILEEILGDYPDFAMAWTQLGDLAHIQGQHEEAEKAYSKSISLRRNNSYEHYRRALVRIGSGNYDAAREDAEVLKERNTQGPRVSYLLGLIDFKNQDFAAAQSQFEKAVNTDPEFMNAIFYLGSAHYYQGHLLQAEQYLSRYQRRFPGSIFASKLLGSTLYQMGNYNKARKVIAPMLQVAPDDPFLLSLMGNIYMKQGNIEDALVSLRRQQELRPDATDLHAQIGLGMMAMGNYSEGTDELQHAVELAQDNHEAEMSLVMVYLKTNETDKAVEVAKTLSAKTPDNPSTLNMLGVTYLANKDYDSARDTFQAVLKIDAGNASAAHNLASMEIREGNVAQARTYYEQVLEQDPGHLRTLLKLAQLDRSLGNNEESLDWLRIAIEKNPEELSPRLHLAREYLTGEQPDKARALLTPAILDRYKEQPALLILLADIDLATGDTGEAIATLQDLVRFMPGSAEARYQLAKAYAISGDTLKSEAELKKALAADPNHIKSRLAQVRKLVGNGETEQARRILDVIAAKYPGDPEVIAQRAWLEAQSGTTADAVSGFEEAYAARPSRELAIELSNAHLRNKDARNGVAVLEEWVAEHPEDDVVWSSLGNTYLMVGDQTKAVSAYESAIAVNPGNATVLNNLAWILREAEPRQAMAYAEKALESDPDSPAFKDTLGVILLEQGNTRRALGLLQESAAADPQNLDTRYHLSMALAENGDVDGATKTLQEILAQEGLFSQREAAAELLKTLGK